ncbi:hypothetical protein CC2G_013301 [Coprinopsis cinerea AmutBmut pab1-1]|nr:hypothetical protein CC2G_013301 [Coprinopsis cinerea AmutBmut pab1-1]
MAGKVPAQSGHQCSIETAIPNTTGEKLCLLSLLTLAEDDTGALHVAEDPEMRLRQFCGVLRLAFSMLSDIHYLTDCQEETAALMHRSDR